MFFLLDNLSSLGVDSSLVCDSRSAIRTACEAQGINVHPFKIAGDLDVTFPFKLWKLCKQTRPDLIHVHSRRGVDYWGGWVAKRLGIPCILSRRVDNPEPRSLVKFKYNLYNRVITISDGIRQVLIKEGLKDEKITLVRSAVDFESFPAPISKEAFLKRFDLNPSHLVIACAAQLISRKGHRFLLEALPRVVKVYPDVRVFLFGKGAEEQNLKKQVQDLGLENTVSFPGFVDDVKSIYPHIDILVHPALMEGLGVALIEASYCKVPIIAAAVGGIPEIVRDQQNGFLVHPGQVEPFQDTLLKLLSDKNLRKQMGQTGHELAIEEFSVNPMVDGNFKVYKSILN